MSIAPRFIVPPWPDSALGALSGKERLDVLNERARLRNEVRTGLIQAVGGIAILIGVYLTWQQIQDNQLALQRQLQTSQDQLQISQNQLRTTQEAQITDRFNKAIEQLGKESLDARLGGIFTLERIMKDSPADNDRIVQILTFYIGSRTASAQSKEFRRVNDKGTKSCWQTATADDVGAVATMNIRKPDVQAAASVLGNRSDKSTIVVVLFEADLRRTNLGGAYLASADLRGTHFEGSILANANLHRAGFGKWRGCNSHLEWSNMVGANLSEADLTESDLTGANLENANLTNADLTAANLRSANFSGAKMEGTRLSGAVANQYTTWPDNFDPGAAGVIVQS